MSEELQCELTEYLTNLPHITTPELGRDMRLGKEADNKFVKAILGVQQNLQHGHVLVMRVVLAERDEEYEELDGYAGIVHDAPINLLAALRKESELGGIKNRCLLENKFPEQIEMVIPPNVIPESDDILNTSGSRAALFSGKVRRFLSSSAVRTTYLEVCPSGYFLGRKFHMHPSVINDLRIEGDESGTETATHVKFRAVNR